VKTFVSIVIVMLTTLSIIGQLLLASWLTVYGPEWMRFVHEPSGEPLLRLGVALSFIASIAAHVICAVILLCEVNE
jgi:type VI protein secretion system component VasK